MLQCIDEGFFVHNEVQKQFLAFKKNLTQKRDNSNAGSSLDLPINLKIQSYLQYKECFTMTIIIISLTSLAPVYNPGFLSDP